MLYRSRTAPSSYQLPDFPHITSRRRQSCPGELYSLCDLQPSLHNAPPTAYITALVFRHVLRRHHHQCCATVRSLVAAAPQPAALLHGKPSPDAVNRREAVLCKDGLRIGSEEGGERDKVGRDYRLIGRLGDGGVGDAIGTGGRSLFDEGKKETARIVVLGQHPSAALQLELARCGRPPFTPLHVCLLHSYSGHHPSRPSSSICAPATPASFSSMKTSQRYTTRQHCGRHMVHPSPPRVRGVPMPPQRLRPRWDVSHCPAAQSGSQHQPGAAALLLAQPLLPLQAGHLCVCVQQDAGARAP
mmetsp:Transcript_5459/g.14198  ORF Transcript_5459/g.14198 Transcript_5459/m.14198 type:complete len:301 (+) Transcript_5459:143-1045(+)